MSKREKKNGNVIHHIQSARQWLERAEHAVNSERNTRGELDLILAKAEVQLAQEKRCRAAEVSTKIMMYLVRPQSLLTIAVGGAAVCMLLFLNGVPNFQPGVNTVSSLRPTSRIEERAIVSTNNQLAIALPSQDRRDNSEMSRGEIKTVTDSSVSYGPASRANAVAARPAGEPSESVQPQLASVSEQEMRMLMRTAERVLRDTK